MGKNPPPVNVFVIDIDVLLCPSFSVIIVKLTYSAATYFHLFCYFMYMYLFLDKAVKALNGLLCGDVPLRNYSLVK